MISRKLCFKTSMLTYVDIVRPSSKTQMCILSSFQLFCKWTGIYIARALTDAQSVLEGI